MQNKVGWKTRHIHSYTRALIYLYLVKIWDQICYPYHDDSEIYPDGNNWKWDSESRNSANGLKHTFTNFEHVVVFMLSKELLEPVRPLAECLQGRLQEVYFGFKKIREITQHYQKIREEVDVEHDHIYRKALELSKQVDSEERMPRIIRGHQSRST